MSRHTDIADAVVAALNGHTFSLAFVAARRYRPFFERDQLAALKVSVVCAAYTSEAADRSRRKSDYAVDVAVQKAVDPESLTACDALTDLLAEIDAFLSMRRLPGLQSATWLGVETLTGAEAGYAVEHLDKLRVFTGVLRMKWRVIEA